MSGGGRRWLGNLLALMASVLLGALLLEAGVLLWMGEQVKFPRHVVGADFGVRINQPGAHYRHKSADVNVHFRINQKGLRADREYPYGKPAGVKRIVSLGDSFTVGYEVEREETFSAILEQELQRRGQAVEVLNAGVSGYSNAEALAYLERELLRYQPDLVLLSFYHNDLVDNVRADLFRLDDDGNLLEGQPSYVPAGRIGNFLNTNPFFNFLSGYSNAFVLIKEALTLRIKAQMVQRNVENLEQAESQEEASAAAQESAAYERRLAAALFQRMLEDARERGIPFFIQSIPAPNSDRSQLVDLFPLAEFDVRQPGVSYLATKPLLDPWLGRELLYHRRSHEHWTPFAHRISGMALAQQIDEEGLLGQSSSPKK